LGIPGEAISQPGAEVPAVREALAWARRGDLLIFALHQDRAPVLALLDSARAQGWSAGEALPV
nr:Mur ligase [Gemmatimonadales bacterium]